MEKIMKPMSGFIVLVLALVLIGLGIYFIVTSNPEYNHEDRPRPILFVGIGMLVVAVFLIKGLTVINPNHSMVCVFFGNYVGTVKVNGLRFVNPFYRKYKISLRANNFESARLKVNDKMGNPVEIAAVIVWYVSDTYKASFDVVSYKDYVKIQSESAIRHLATSCPYDEMEDTSAEVTLRNGGDKVIDMLEKELGERLAAAGITVKEA